jgi:hypothetical protein
MIATRHGLKVVVVDRMGVGGQIATAGGSNFPGFRRASAATLGPLLRSRPRPRGPSSCSTIKGLEIAGDARILRGAAELALGGHHRGSSALRPLGIPAKPILGRGVSHCASCDTRCSRAAKSALSAVAMRRWTNAGPRRAPLASRSSTAGQACAPSALVPGKSQ